MGVRLELRRSGGFAGNIRRPPLVVDTSTLPDAEAGELEALANSALATAAAPAAPSGADRTQLELAVERDDGGRRSIAVQEPGAPPELRELAKRMADLAGR